MSSLTKTQKRRERLRVKKQEDKDFDEIISHYSSDSECSSTGYTSDGPATPSSSSDLDTPIKSNVSMGSEHVVSEQELVKKADEIWKIIKTYRDEHKEFANVAAKDQLKFFREKMGMETFMNEFPIVARYMICMGQFKTKAFKKLLYKMRTVVHPSAENRAKGYMEDEWVKRQADYVMYLWQEYKGKHYNTKEREWIWESTYRMLKGEFDDFRDMHKDAEKKIAEEKKEYIAENAKELLMRLVEGKQKLTPEDEDKLRAELGKLSLHRKWQNVMAELKELVEETEPSCVGQGCGPDKPAPKVTMIETVDVDRMREIGDKFRPDELKGMEPIEEDGQEEDLGEETEIVTTGYKEFIEVAGNKFAYKA